jgi:frataxin
MFLQKSSFKIVMRCARRSAGLPFTALLETCHSPSPQPLCLTAFSSHRQVVRKASFSTISSAHVPSVSAAVSESFPEINFHKICDTTLEQIADSLSGLDSSLDDVDINLSQGVLSVNLGPEFGNKTWVINKQTPNRQIWWSSPVSGPRRYEFIGDKNGNGTGKGRSTPLASDWRFSKNEQADLWTDLKSEIQKVTNIELAFNV